MKENIEEDLKVVEKLIETMEQDRITFKDEQPKEIYAFFIKALQNILTDYKRVLKENEEWQKAYQEEKDKQFELLRENQLAKEALKKQCDIADERNQLLIENQKLQKENEELKHKYDIFVKMNSEVIENSILKQKINDKIEELKERPLTINENNKYYYETDAYNKIIIQVLQKLLEEKDKVIDLMSEMLTTPIHNKEWIKQYYENKAKE